MATVQDRFCAKLVAARRKLQSRIPGLDFTRWTEHMPATVKEPVGREFGESIRMAGGGQWAAAPQLYWGGAFLGFGGGGPAA